MAPKLKPLLLPILVEARRKTEYRAAEIDSLSTSFHSQSSVETTSPLSPTFSLRRHYRNPSSISSVDSAFYNNIMDSPASSVYGQPSNPGKRLLPDVQEEIEKDEEDFDMLADFADLYHCWCDSNHCLHRTASMAQSTGQLPTARLFDDDNIDGFMSDCEPRKLYEHRKKRKTSDITLTEISQRIEGRFPSISRKWRLRKGSNAASISSDTQQDYADSMPVSSRSSSRSNNNRRMTDQPFDYQLPPTPTRSIFEEEEEVTEDVHSEVDAPYEEPERTATTPLLPPLMMNTDEGPLALQSPLQSPSIEEPSDPLSSSVAPIGAVLSPQMTGMPSPPLSSRPSVSSFHARPCHTHVMPSEAPPILMAEPDDEWANKLGHANFTINPEPYTPFIFDLEACRQLRLDWELARCNYTRHLVRTGEHYGVTSKTYRLTQEKWDEVDAVWRANNDMTIAHTVENSSTAFATLKHTTFGDGGHANIMTKIPSLHDLRGGTKFPQLGDEDIVGPMVRDAAVQLKRAPTKTAKLFKFFVDRFPVGFKAQPS